MRFINKTHWVAVIDIVDTVQNEARTEIGMIAAGKDVEIPIETFSSQTPDKKIAHEGTITLAFAERTQEDRDVFYVTPSIFQLRPLVGAEPLAIRLSCMEKPDAGAAFAIEIPDEELIEAKRKEAKELFGRDIHIRAQIGPLTDHGNGRSLGCPIKAVDDESLKGNFSQFPRKPGHILIVGYFK